MNSSTWTRHAALTLLVTFLMVAGGAGVSAAQPSATLRAAGGACTSIQVSSHRGETTREITENTVEAFRRARNVGARSMETDLRLTSDRVWVLMHDPTVNRTTRGRGEVVRHSLAWLKQLRTNGGERVPTLQELLDSQPTDMGYQLEFKISGASDRKLLEAINAIRLRGVAERTFLTSRHRSVLKRLATLAPEMERGLIMERRRRVDPSRVPSYTDSVNVLHTVASATYVRRMHRVGKQVLARTANTTTTWRRLVSRDIDRIVTDNIGGYARWCY